MARNAAGKRELFEQPPHSLAILGDVREEFAVGSLKVGVGNHSRSTVSRAAYVNHVEPILPDDPVAVDINEIQARRCTPMTEQTGLDVIDAQRIGEQRIVIEIDLSDREIV